ncbi:hypothetical protein SCUCBS95973_006451 [Sporothrix curviconia]|uniref:Uncharacterized protein n=1 Tax=Sporothrix curviconia TaxID=1260050 RepID=A0ABP0C5I9_9PEZI
MARKLPWERLGGSARPTSKPRPSTTAARRSFSPGPSSSRGDDEDNGRGCPSKRQRSTRPDRMSRYRTPSTSPPPAPPSESFMIDGMDNDDRYRMVEDELLAVAHMFTAHLHAAEYQRLRAKAKSQTAAALRSLARPVTATTPTARVARKQAAAREKTKQKAALRAFAGVAGDGDRDKDDDKDDDQDKDKPWTGSALEDLMENDPRKARPSLVSLASITAGRPGSQTKVRRPAPVPEPADEEEEEEEDDDDDDDDLDGPMAERRPAPAARATWPDASRPQPTTRHAPPEKRSVSFAPKTREIAVHRYDRDEMDDDSHDEDDDEDDDLDADNLMQKLRERRAQEKALRQQKQQQRRQAARAREEDYKPESLDTIPSFL